MAADGFPKIISVDDHVQEPPDLWSSRVPSALREDAPRIQREWVDDQGSPVDRSEPGFWCDVWYYADVARVPTTRFHAAVGFAPEEVMGIPMTFDDMRPGAYQVKPRLEDMDVAGVEASLCFPNHFSRFSGQRFLQGDDRDLALKCVEAYNDFLLEQWMGPSGGRLAGAMMLPMWDANLSAAEVRRNAARGFTVTCFSEVPAWLGLPSLYSGEWDPLMEACSETGTVIAMHIGSGSRGTPLTSDDAPLGLIDANLYTNSSLSLTDWLMSGLLVRFPRLQLEFAEAQAGWIPYLLGRLDRMWVEGKAHYGMQGLNERPSHYFRQHVTTCVFADPVGLGALREVIGVDRICFETDYPHPDSTWPDCSEYAQEQLQGASADTIEKIIRGNAKRLLRI
jgi:predicted TIM-barrel fold metal-dependent hydrolase